MAAKEVGPTPSLRKRIPEHHGNWRVIKKGAATVGFRIPRQRRKKEEGRPWHPKSLRSKVFFFWGKEKVLANEPGGTKRTRKHGNVELNLPGKCIRAKDVKKRTQQQGGGEKRGKREG